MNLTIMQYFEWHLPDDGEHWNRLKDDAQRIKGKGFDAVWLPPPTKADSTTDPGYAVYDVYDLGEFDQKGDVRTKYGTREQLEAAIAACKEADLLVYIDLVMNHKAAGDEAETFKVIEVDQEDREKDISEPFDIEGYTRFFTFPEEMENTVTSFGISTISVESTMMHEKTGQGFSVSWVTTGLEQ
ncbi:alpha-amylase family glycosyl hydrolase [Salinicoccus siamensis]|uniref:alpha-amylase family glycosyl hydrolase n=1 Tax=Salinicoccus siamensis TaxID=381830 RepID=UPI0036194975